MKNYKSENLHVLALIYDTFENILYCVDIINPTEYEWKKMHEELDLLPEDIYASMVESIESPAGTFEEILEDIPVLNDYVKLNRVVDVLA